MIINVYTYKFTDSLGSHVHSWKSGPYDPKAPVTCPTCLQRLTDLREKLRVKYGLPEGWWK